MQNTFTPSQNRNRGEWNTLYQVSYFRLPTHTYHGLGLSVEPRGDLCPSLLDPWPLISPHMHPRYYITCPYTRLPSACSIVEFLVFSADKGSENPLPPKGKSRLLIDSSPVSYLSTLTLPIPSPVYGIISQCPMYRIQVAFDSADNPPVFSCFTNYWSESEIKKLIEKFLRIWPGCGIEPAPFFYLGFASEELLFQMRTQVFSKK